MGIGLVSLGFVAIEELEGNALLKTEKARLT
jgi:hypothetical protein